VKSMSGRSTDHVAIVCSTRSAISIPSNIAFSLTSNILMS